LILIVVELGESINQHLRSQQPVPRPFTIEVQTRLHARACQIANKVAVLLGAGFAEGAIARWRSLHEVAVVSMFIGGDEGLAERYRLHEAVESLRVARLYVRHQDRLGLLRRNQCEESGQRVVRIDCARRQMTIADSEPVQKITALDRQAYDPPPPAPFCRRLGLDQLSMTSSQ
jgi:hypothetical protein